MYVCVCRSVEQLDLTRVCWVPVEPMLSRRSTLGVGVLNGELYAVGGFDGNNGLDSVEKYNPGIHVYSVLLDTGTLWRNNYNPSVGTGVSALLPHPGVLTGVERPRK